jgi:hypothetical protein
MLAVLSAAAAEPVPGADAPPPPAAAASPARRCADAATGTEVEVCLRLAAEHPDAVDEITAALVAWVDRVEGPDRALLEALVLLHGGSAIEGCERLGATGDPRAETLLADTVRTHAEEGVRVAAVYALARFPSALPELVGWVEDRSLPTTVRTSAVEALSRLPDAAGREMLLELARRPGLPTVVQRSVLRVLARDWPQLSLGELPPAENGAPWLAAGSSASLGYALAAAGWFGRTQRWEVGAVTGATAGATAGWIYGRAWPKEAGDAGLVATSGGLGTASGFLLGYGLADGDLDAAFLGGLGGEGAGLLLSAVATGVHRGDGADALEATALASLIGGAAAAGAAARGEGGAAVALAAGVGLAGGTVVGQLAAPGVLLPRDLGPVGAGAALGLAGGALVPSRAPGFALLAGGLGGAAAGGLVGAWADPPPDLLVGAMSGAGFGGALGAGAALAAGAPSGVRTGLGVGGGAVGLLAGTAVALIDADPLDDRDAVLTGTAALWAGWNAVALARLTDAPPDRAAGAVLLSAAATGGVTLAGNVLVDVPVPQTLCATSLGIWGGYVGYQAGVLAGVDPLAVALPASDAGFALGGVLVSPLGGVPPLVLGVADAGGVFGGAAGALVAGLATADEGAVTASSLVGAGLGGAVGLGVGAVWHRSQGRRDVVHLPRALPPIALAPGPTGLGLAVTVGPW